LHFDIVWFTDQSISTRQREEYSKRVFSTRDKKERKIGVNEAVADEGPRG
jgi:hypothetical protein